MVLFEEQTASAELMNNQNITMYHRISLLGGGGVVKPINAHANLIIFSGKIGLLLTRNEQNKFLPIFAHFGQNYQTKLEF